MSRPPMGWLGARAASSALALCSIAAAVRADPGSLAFARLDDRTIAAVLNYVVFDLARAQQGTKPLTMEEVAAERPHAIAGAELRKRREALLQRLGL